MKRLSEKDQKIADEIDKWLVLNVEKGCYVVREDAPVWVRKEQERLAAEFSNPF